MAWHDAEKLRDHPDVQMYIDDLEGPQKEVCDAVRAQAKQDPEVLEFIAWGVPCYWRKGPLCYTSAAKTHVTLGFFRGLEIGQGLQGTGKSPVAKAVVKNGRGLPDEFDAWLDAAVALDEAGED